MKKSGIARVIWLYLDHQKFRVRYSKGSGISRVRYSKGRLYILVDGEQLMFSTLQDSLTVSYVQHMDCFDSSSDSRCRVQTSFGGTTGKKGNDEGLRLRSK